MRPKVLSIFGTRPEAIKMAPVLQNLTNHAEAVDSRVCVTAQHRQMLDQVLELFQIRPDIDLDIMQPKQSPSMVAAAVLQALDPLLNAEKPDWVLVQGDTTTVLATCLAAFHRGIPVGHVEAGLRTYDLAKPFPEEMNRRVAGIVATFHFAPTRQAFHNLTQEGVAEEKIVITGNTIIDAVRQVAAMPFDPEGTPLSGLPFKEKKLILVTAHRRESFGHGIEEICAALREIAARRPDVHLVYPVHLNPNIREPVNRLLGKVPGISLIEPLGYLPLVFLMKNSHLILTDSGGIQEEAPGLGVPVLVLREVTERPEGVAAGVVRVVGTHRDRIAAEALRLLEDEAAYRAMAQAVNPYGDGHAAERIVAALLGLPFEPFASPD
jgi:UDP-N-acetylglucosamine 2-epimerase (non-hydrolysing)